MRLGAALSVACFASLALALTSACSGGYPLPPTKCDEYCDATKGMMCDRYYEPAGCVLSCEQGDMDNAACSGEMDEIIACYRRNPSLTKDCDWNGQPKACDAESLLLSACVATQYSLRQPRQASAR